MPLKKYLPGVICFGVLSLFFLTSPQAFSLKLASCNWEPYNSENLPKNGFACEIISEAFNRSGHSVTFKFLPWKRAVEEGRKGNYHGVFGSYYSEERAKDFVFTAPYITGPLVLCSVKGSSITYKTLRDLIPYKIGVVRGYVNTREFDQADYLSTFPVTNDLQNIKKLLKGRVDLIVIDKYQALYHLKNNATVQGDITSVEFVEPPLEEKNIHLMIPRSIDIHKQLVADFNRGFKQIEADGTLKDILIQNGFFNPDNGD